MSVIVGAQILQRVEHEVAQILAETEVPVEVYAATLEAIGRALGWELGAVWHEQQAWSRFLHSERGATARDAYLRDTFEGKV